MSQPVRRFRLSGRCHLVLPSSPDVLACRTEGGAQMPATGYPFQMAGGMPVVTAPSGIDATTVSELRAILFEWLSRGHTTVVVDLTATQFCDSAGLRELAW